MNFSSLVNDRRKQAWLWLNGGVAFALVLAADQLSKWLVMRQFNGLVMINSGLSWSIGADFLSGEARLLWWVLLSLLMLAMFYYLRSFWFKHPIAAGLVFGGGMSNLIDRLRFGGVVDWIPMHLFKNNLADWAIFAGLSIIMINFYADNFSRQ